MDASLVLDEFIRKTEVHPLENHSDLLFQARDLVNLELRNLNYPIETVRLAHRIYGYMGNEGINDRVDLMTKFLQNANGNLEDKFWAKWEIVDNLALLKRYPEMINEQQAFLLWSKAHMQSDFLIQVMYDSTQALGWFELKMTDKWFEIYHELISRVARTAANRRARVLYVETATGLLVYNLQRYEDAVPEIERYYSVINEDPLWDGFDEFNIRVKSYELGLYSGRQQWDNYNRVVEEATRIITDCIAKYERGEHVEINQICDMAHEIGTCLMWEKRYEQAIPLFEYAVSKQGTGVTHFFYAMCIWATEKNKEKTLYHLRMAETTTKGNKGLRSRYKHMFLDTQEFVDVCDDGEFLSVFNQ